MIRVIRHTDADYQALLAAAVNPDNVQPREQAVTCGDCGATTWNLSARCDRHYVAPPRALRAGVQ